LRTLHGFVRMSQTPRVRRYETSTTVTVTGFDPESLSEFRMSQQALENKYNKLMVVYNRHESAFHELNDKAKKLKENLDRLTVQHAKLVAEYRAARMSAYISRGADAEAKKAAAQTAYEAMDAAGNAMNAAGVAMNAVVDECNRVAGLMNAAGEEVNAVRKLIL
jgi:septal ring factor EnvC (AmiA/AmiB activator)